MRCLLCAGWSFRIICAQCRDTHLKPVVRQRRLSNRLDVYSFYPYDDVSMLLHTKHDALGHPVFHLLARQTMRRFAQAYECDTPIAAVGIDDHVRRGYAHTAILSRALRCACITPRYGKLRAGSDVSYSGQSFAYRLANPRNFSVGAFRETEVILVDDIVTSGLTLTQAAEALRSEGKVVRFALVLADAER